MGKRQYTVTALVILALCQGAGCASQNNKTAPKAVWSFGPTDPLVQNNWSTPAPESCFERLGALGCSDQPYKADEHTGMVWNIISVHVPVPDF